MSRREEARRLALRAVEAAGEVVRERMARPGDVAAEEKSRGDYVTAVDRDAEAAAVAVLRQAGDAPVLGEEGGGDSTAEHGWVVDPVDGTTNLVRHFPIVGVSVALMEDGRPVAGAVGAPLLSATWSAAEGEGAHDHRGRLLSVSAHGGDGIAATGFPFKHNKQKVDRYVPVFAAALRSFEDLRRAGAASLDLAYCAQGTWDGFFELGLSLWDIAAGALLVREAGGVVTDWHGDPRAVFSSGDIVAGAPRWHERMLALLA